MTNILSSGYSVLNPIAPSGVAVAGNPNSGSLSQYNNKQADTISAGEASANGSVKKVIATDANDIVNLGTDWTNAGTSTDQITGIAGTLYTSSSGDQLLISGGAAVNQTLALRPTPDNKPKEAPTPQTTTTDQTLQPPSKTTQNQQRPNKIINLKLFSILMSNLIYNNPLSEVSYSTSHLNNFGLASVKPIGYYA